MISLRGGNKTVPMNQQNLLASCVDGKKLRDNGIEYIKENMILAMDALTFIDLLKLNL